MADNNGNIEIGNERERECLHCSRFQHQIVALKEVSALRKGLLDIKEKEVKDLIDKLKFFQDAIDKEREIRECLTRRVESAEQQCMVLTENLQRNVESIGEMQSSYDNQIATLISDLEASDAQLRECKDELSTCQEKNVELNKQVSDLDRLVVDNKRVVRRLENQLKVTVDRNKVLAYQMSLLNNLFNETDVVLIDFDKIKAIGDIVRETHNLPELELHTAGDEQGDRRPSIDLENVIEKIDSEKNSEEIPGEESCYKSVDTSRGPQLVLSVSRTFIKLKDLILEKKSLQREIDTLKTLNSKLETKVDKQERRLYCVTVELNKTWSLVSKLKVQHNKLHTNEAVLKYELHEKRLQLEKLKTDLSVSREKWLKARQKNSESQIVWQNLRDEFSRRKLESSQESAFSENMSSSSTNEDEEGVTVSKSSDEPSNEPDEPEGAYGITLIPDPDEEIVEDFMDPLEDMVSDLVEEIEATAAEGDAEDEGIDDTANSSEESSSDRVIRRANRLRMLEEQCHLLHSKLAASTARSTALASKLASLHSHYGSRDSDPENSENYHHEDSSQVDEATPSTSTADADSTVNQMQSEVYDTEMPSSENDSQIEEMSVINHSSENNESESNSGTDTIHNAQIVLDVQSVPPVDFVESLPNAEIVEPFVHPMNASDSTENLSLGDSLQMPNLVITTHNPVVVENANLNIDTTHVVVDPILQIIQQVDLLGAEFDDIGDSADHLSELDVSREESPELHPLLPINFIENESDEEDRENNNESSSSSSEGSFSGASPDPNFLGRLIIKQLPLRLEILKKENQALMKEAVEVKLEMKETERLLRREVSKHKKSNEKLKNQIENKNLVEFELREDLGRKEQTIEELQKEIEEAKIISDDCKRKVEAVNDLMKKISEEKADMERSKVTFKSTKFCYGCDKTFSLFKRKHHCTICGQVFCKSCASKSKTSASPETRSVTKCRICKTCEGRRDEINILATQFNDKTL